MGWVSKRSKRHILHNFVELLWKKIIYFIYFIYSFILIWFCKLLSSTCIPWLLLKCISLTDKRSLALWIMRLVCWGLNFICFVNCYHTCSFHDHMHDTFHWQIRHRLRLGLCGGCWGWCWVNFKFINFRWNVLSWILKLKIL